jgi:hypothetical protein
MRSSHWLSSAAALAFVAGALAQGADIVHSDINGIAVYGPVNGKLAYALGSNTCNIGTANSEWTNGGSPGLAMNIYRLHNGRLMQLGASFVKHSCCAAAGNGCSTLADPPSALTCNGAGGSQLGAGCRDVYGASYNGGQSRLGPRSGINPWTGAFTPISAGTGDAVFRRSQVNQSDMNTTTFPGALWLGEGVYVATADAVAGNRNNNASYKRLTNTSNGTVMGTTGTTAIGIPAIRAWRDLGGPGGTPDTSVTVAQADFAGEGRFWYAQKVTNNGNGTWRYEYAVFNLSSQSAGGVFTIGAPASVAITNMGFYAPANHSNEVYNNNAWTMTRGTNSVTWATDQTFAQNPNANSLTWGKMFNFWFDANSAPDTVSSGMLSAFRTSQSAQLNIVGPVSNGLVCDSIDINRDGVLPDTADIDQFLSLLSGGSCVPTPPATECGDLDFNNDGLFPDTADIDALLSVFSGGPCI